MKLIFYYTNCVPEKILVSTYVTFHIFFPVDHMPVTLKTRKFDCQGDFKRLLTSRTYKTAKKLDYPVNVGRMISRETAMTKHIFVADIELYPSPNLISKFLDMIITNGPKEKTVYVLPIFEIDAESKIPRNKSELVNLIKISKVQIFHKKFCSPCHTVPEFEKWLKLPDDGGNL